MASSPESLQQRTALAELVRRFRQEVAEEVTAEFLRRHPDWVERYGERARIHGIADALFHQDFLAGAIESDSPGAFQDYTRWTAGMLAARGIDPAFIRENLRQIGDALAARLTEADRAHVSRFDEAGCGTADTLPETGVPSSDATIALRSVYVQALLQGAGGPR